MFFKVFFSEKNFATTTHLSELKILSLWASSVFPSPYSSGCPICPCPCHVMPWCHAILLRLCPKPTKASWEKRNILLSFVALCTYLFPQCNQVVFVNQPGRNHGMDFWFCWQQINSFLRKLSWSRRRSLTTSPALYCPLSVCNQYISIARILNCLSFTWIAERIFVGFSNRLTLS